MPLISTLAWLLFGIFGPWQIAAIVALIALIIFWVIYRRKML